jgi:hypothetical protein
VGGTSVTVGSAAHVSAQPCEKQDTKDHGWIPPSEARARQHHTALLWGVQLFTEHPGRDDLGIWEREPSGVSGMKPGAFLGPEL